VGRPIITFFREMQPVRITVQLQDQSTYRHVGDRAHLAYRLGFTRDPGVGQNVDLEDSAPDQIVQPSASNTSKTTRINWSTQSRLSESVRMDLSMTYSNRKRDGNNLTPSEDKTLDWPVVTLGIQRVHEWGIFGDLLSNSSIDVSYRRSKTESGSTATSRNPRTAVNVSPRWTFTFRNKLSGNLNLNYNNGETESAGRTLVTRRLGGNVKLQKSFDAQGFFGFLRFGREGYGSTIDASLDISYDRQRSFRRQDVDGEVKQDQERGSNRLSVTPNFSYQFSRSLRGGMRLGYSRSTDINSDVTTQSFIVGINATLSF
jgi:hypothetical protein